QNTKIDVLGLRPLLSCVVVSETVGVKKPDARIYQIAQDTLKMPAAAIAFVGDNPMLDVIGPRQAGMKAIWLRGVFEWPTHQPPPEHSIQQLDELFTLI